MTNSSTTHDLLRYLKDRIVRLEEERKAFAKDIKNIYDEGASKGFDKAALRKVVKRAMMTGDRRKKEQATEEIADVYLAGLGLLDGSPLNDAARPKPKDDPPPEHEDEVESEPPDLPQDEPPSARAAESQETNVDARARGMADARAGLSVFKNPYVAGDPRRAFWDEGWCEEVGSDGMDVPDPWRRKSPPKPPEDCGDDA